MHFYKFDSYFYNVNMLLNDMSHEVSVLNRDTTKRTGYQF